MIMALTMPAWGMEDAPGTVVGWLVHEGDAISLGQELVEIETTKLTNVVESPFAGTMARIVLAKGETAPTGALLAVIDDGTATTEEIATFVGQNRQAEAPPAEKSPQEKVIQTPRGRVRIVTLEGGAATPLLLLHGFGADWTSWSLLARGLARTRTVHAMDLPGHGGSFKDVGTAPLDAIVEVVLAIVDEIGGPAHVAGHSLGGLVATKAAVQVPEMFRSLSLLAPAGIGQAINGAFLDAFASADSRRNARAALEMLVDERDSISLAMTNDIIRARRVEGAKKALQAIRLALADGDTQHIDLRSDLAALKMPVQVILGANDRIVTGIETGGLPNATIVADAGHLLHMEKAGEVQKKIENFLGGE